MELSRVIIIEEIRKHQSLCCFYLAYRSYLVISDSPSGTLDSPHGVQTYVLNNKRTNIVQEGMGCVWYKIDTGNQLKVDILRKAPSIDSLKETVQMSYLHKLIELSVFCRSSKKNRIGTKCLRHLTRKRQHHKLNEKNLIPRSLSSGTAYKGATES